MLTVVVGTYREGGPPTDLVDRLAASAGLITHIELLQQITKYIAKLDGSVLLQLFPYLLFMMLQRYSRCFE